MSISKTTWFVFVCVVTIMTLSVTAFEKPRNSEQPNHQSVGRVKPWRHDEAIKRYPVAEFEESEPTDPAKQMALKERKVRNNEHEFSQPSADDGAIGWFPEKNLDFPALPIDQSDVILIGQILSAQAHRSENKRGIFSEFEVRVDEVLKGPDPTVTAQAVIIVERTGGFLKYPNGRQVLFFVDGYGMPEVGARNVLFLRIVGHGFKIVTVYELSRNGVLPLDRGNQFRRFEGESERVFVNTLRESIVNARPQ